MTWLASVVPGVFCLFANIRSIASYIYKVLLLKGTFGIMILVTFSVNFCTLIFFLTLALWQTWLSVVRLEGRIGRDWSTSIMDIQKDSGKSHLRWSLASGLLGLFLPALDLPSEVQRTWTWMDTQVSEAGRMQWPSLAFYLLVCFLILFLYFLRSHSWCLWC